MKGWRGFDDGGAVEALGTVATMAAAVTMSMAMAARRGGCGDGIHPCRWQPGWKRVGEDVIEVMDDIQSDTRRDQ